MHRLTRRGIQLALTTMGFAGLIVAVNAIPAAATPVAPAGSFRSEVLGRGTDMSHGSLPIKQGLQIVVSRNTVDAGGSSGWHSHPGGAIVVVQQGEITTYRSAGKGDEEEGAHNGSSRCIITRYTQGQAFIERPGEPLDAVNTGSTQTIILATFPGVPVGGSQRTDQPNPRTCPV